MEIKIVNKSDSFPILWKGNCRKGIKPMPFVEQRTKTDFLFYILEICKCKFYKIEITPYKYRKLNNPGFITYNWVRR